MLKLYRTFRHTFAYGLVLSAIALSSCKKEDISSCGGTPGIMTVSATTSRSTAVTTGNLADWVIIQGSNFCSVSSVAFNDVEADLKNAYITPNEITLQVPRVVPKNVTNTITVTTAGGTAQAKYTVSIPPLAVTGMSNEYALAGEKVGLAGQNFDLYGVTAATGKVYFNTTAVAITKATPDSVYFIMPAGVAVGAVIKVAGTNNFEKQATFRYKDDRNILFNYDKNGSVWGGTDFITSGAAPGSISGAYLRVNQSIAAWTWTEVSANNNIVIPADALAKPGNYLLKFEMNTLKPFTTNTLRIAIDGDPGGNPPVNTYLWHPTTPFSTGGKWRTRSVKLSDFLTKTDPTKATHEVRVIIFDGDALEADMSFDNFRIIPVN
ncbi:hypothetical protein E4631_15380 [Hymenobacter sp. UV11]|uniref:glycan-binding surface protein n=1 Tax=Hymenobacter sp. UV11 TaxID=1849735 RepID=UPI001060EFC0|nr:glycan-binding surface protein [Hymenobacter sp. UV11]TDN39319.1 hypothetical protein A8B98_18845 [Hymenobacter sp. UV11]TFZ65602.1 hypothetical protein E4631_15380 [Hymenobacter sp. UV11]